MNVGEVWIVQLSDVIGHEQSGERPAIVIAVHQGTQLASVVPISSASGLDRFGFVVPIKKSTRNGLKEDSTAMIFQLRSLAFPRFRRKIGSLDGADFNNVKKMIRGYLSL